MADDFLAGVLFLSTFSNIVTTNDPSVLFLSSSQVLANIIGSYITLIIMLLKKNSMP